MSAFDIESYLTHGVEEVVKSIVKTSLFCPAETAFIAKFAAASVKASERRHQKSAQLGTHVPSYLIASIPSRCNLHCAGCYARSLSTCDDGEPVDQMSASEWGRIFAEAQELGVSFILLAGGEPLVRRDVIEEAVKYPEILFPIFTNGTMLTDAYLPLLDKHRNLVPVISIEGGAAQTDGRRGAGIYARVSAVMAELRKKYIAFATSITVTKDNLDEVTDDAFVAGLADQGCKGIIYVEYVPTSAETERLAPTETERGVFAERLSALRERYDKMLFVSFPGDEKDSGGCLAAGRGFFHINSHGGAEPCPFSPYSDISVRDHTLAQALMSPLFTSLRSGNLLTGEHTGGCVLFEKRAQVEALLYGKESEGQNG